MVNSEHDIIMTSLMNYPEFKFSFFDFLLIKTTVTTTITNIARIIRIINIIAVVTGSPVFKPVLELPDPNPDPDPV